MRASRTTRRHAKGMAKGMAKGVAKGVAKGTFGLSAPGKLAVWTDARVATPWPGNPSNGKSTRTQDAAPVKSVAPATISASSSEWYAPGHGRREVKRWKRRR